MAAIALLVAVTACSDDDGEVADQSEGTVDTVVADESQSGESEESETSLMADDLLGPVDPAWGDPVLIGMVSDGATAANDNTDEIWTRPRCRPPEA